MNGWFWQIACAAPFVLALTIFPTPVRAQGPATLPTVDVPPVIPTVSIPPAAPRKRALTAWEVLYRMQAAMQREGSVHFETLVNAHLDATRWVTVRTRGDLSWRRNLLDEINTAQRTGPQHNHLVTTSESWQLVIAGQQAASRSGTVQWQCERVPGNAAQSNIIPFQVHILKPFALSTMQFDGQPVWHLQATANLPATGATQLTTLDYYIAKRGDMLLRSTVTARENLNGQIEPVIIDERYSHYGETVTAQLPVACSAHKR